MGNKGTILITDDEPKIREVIASWMQSRGYEVLEAETGMQALDIIERENLSLVLLDLMLPDISGEEVCRRIRTKSRIPVIMLTAKTEEEDMLKGLGVGADDYMKKPFSLKELGARTEAILRRTSDDLIPLFVKNSFGGGDLVVDFEQGTVLKQGCPVSLTRTEQDVLAALIKYPGKVFTREELIMLALGEEYDGYDRAVDSHIKNLRHKIEDNPRQPVYVLTVHGKGYRFGGGRS